ncbi:MAG TPA: VOC family protein [Burkholderiaceae bacterium]|nr:VOC family protein [Burkholderiaceae bacterium]
MVACLDHIAVVAPSLETGAAYVEAALGVQPDAGRAHPGMATHNLLLALGPSVYLEVVAPDPTAAPVARPRWFGLDHVLQGSSPRLAAWVASTNDIVGTATPELGTVETMRRGAYTWRMTIRADGSVPLEGAAPLLIQRSSGARPVASLPQRGLHLQGLQIRHPAPAQVLDLLARIGLASEPTVTVTQGKDCSLVAEIQTPFGLRELR